MSASRWVWGEGLADTFDAHIAASVPLYESGLALAAELSDWFTYPGSTVYDLGCSTGAVAEALATRHPRSSIIGVDAEPQMTAAASERCRELSNVTIETASVVTMTFDPASLIVAHHLAQFLTLAERARLLVSAYDALTPGGALLLFEKTLPVDVTLALMAASALASHKLGQGLSAADVLAKDFALRGVLMARTVDEVRAELADAGFTAVHSVLRWMNWDGFLAIKGER